MIKRSLNTIIAATCLGLSLSTYADVKTNDGTHTNMSQHKDSENLGTIKDIYSLDKDANIGVKYTTSDSGESVTQVTLEITGSAGTDDLDEGDRFFPLDIKVSLVDGEIKLDSAAFGIVRDKEGGSGISGEMFVAKMNDDETQQIGSWGKVTTFEIGGAFNADWDWGNENKLTLGTAGALLTGEVEDTQSGQSDSGGGLRAGLSMGLKFTKNSLVEVYALRTEVGDSELNQEGINIQVDVQSSIFGISKTTKKVVLTFKHENIDDGVTEDKRSTFVTNILFN